MHHQAASFFRVITVITLIATCSVSVFPSARAKSYTAPQKIEGLNFLDAFDFEDGDDPTHGRVDYVNRTEAVNLALVETKANAFFLRAESTEVVEGGRGRKSVRLKSKQSRTTHVAIYNILHMPQGCGTWPALWTVGARWPAGGEIDILEGVNDNGPNAATLHTSPGCVIGDKGGQLGVTENGTWGAQDCAAGGCQVRFPNPNSYGPEFNRDGGGVYAVERTTQYIKIWFWSRTDSSVPSQIKNPGEAVDPDTWGTPMAYFEGGDQCNMQERFKPHSFIINLTFCGDWAGNTYGGKCPGKCEQYVDENPKEFKDAYFEIAYIYLYSPVEVG